MNALIILALFAYYTEASTIAEKCPGAEYDTVSKEVLKNDIGGAYQLAIDYDTNTLFFSFTRDDNGKSTFESANINLITNELKIIKGIEGGFANTVDREHHVVYLGGQNGIYTFDYKTDIAKHVAGSSHKIWQLFYKKELYYTKYPEEEVYLFRNGQSQRLPQLSNTRGMLVALDNNENILFSNSSGLFILENNHQKSTTYLGDYNINGFSSDVDGRIFFSTPNAIFSIDGKNNAVKQLVSIDDVYGVAIERDGSIIYSSEDSIIRLKHTKKQC